MGKFDETIKNHFYTPAEKVEELAAIDGTVPAELLQQAKSVTETKLGNGADEFARNMADWDGRLPQRPVPPRAQMIANEEAAIREGGKLLPKVKDEAVDYLKGQGMIPAAYRATKSYVSDPASQERTMEFLKPLIQGLGDQVAPRAINGGQAAISSQTRPALLTPEQQAMLQQWLSEGK
jgi:hypothetical protein